MLLITRRRAPSQVTVSFAQLNDLRETLQSPAEAGQRSILQDFREARLQAGLQEVLARVTGQSNRLLSFEEVSRQLRLAGRSDGGVREIPLAAIVGSVGRYSDFTRTFLPRRDSDRDRWARVKAAFTGPDRAALPPIEVYQVGEVYFVLDGNHRVSVARRLGLTHLEAHVIAVPSAVPLTPGLQPDDLIVKAEHADFLERTGLGATAAQCDLSLTAPGGYRRLRAEIEAGRASGETETEAARGWYTATYLPLVLAIRAQGLLRWFPGRTEADLYLWIGEHRQALAKELAWAIRPDAAAADLAVRHNAQATRHAAQPGSWRQTRLEDRYADHLFADVLAALDDSPAGWQALDQALVLARREGARLHGLHVTPPDAALSPRAAEALRRRFDEQCAAAEVFGRLVIETGVVARQICERARLADMVVLSATHPPVNGLASLGSGLRAIIWDCPRPVLAVPGAATPLQRALLTYDGSPKAKEALFVAAYLAERWHTTLRVLALRDGPRVGSGVLDYPRAYLAWHELEAEFVLAGGGIETFVEQAADHQADLVLMGGYSVSAVAEVMGGSAVNYMLRQARCPLLLCR